MNTTEKKFAITMPSDTEVLMTRAFNAPREIVYQCFTKCEHLKHWWGQELTHCEMDVRVGGQWKRTSKSADGQETPFSGEYKEIVPNELLSYTMIMGAGQYQQPALLETVMFHDENGGTKISTIVKFPDKQLRDGAAPYMESGAGQAYDKLEKLLETLD
jgi:uncharacterized protein YndB with AHSA1/START domain